MSTVEEFAAARKALANGYKHQIRITGSSEFKKKVKEILTYIKTAGYYDFLRTYIRTISEVDGISQLREADASIWLNVYMLANPFECARFFIQKVEQMKNFLRAEQNHIVGERLAVERSVSFLTKLRDSLEDVKSKAECEEVLKEWREARIV